MSFYEHFSRWNDIIFNMLSWILQERVIHHQCWSSSCSHLICVITASPSTEPCGTPFRWLTYRISAALRLIDGKQTRNRCFCSLSQSVGLMWPDSLDHTPAEMYKHQQLIFFFTLISTANFNTSFTCILDFGAHFISYLPGVFPGW